MSCCCEVLGERTISRKYQVTQSLKLEKSTIICLNSGSSTMCRLFQRVARLWTPLLDNDPNTTHCVYKARLLGTVVFLLWLSLHLFLEVAKGISSKHESMNVVTYGERCVPSIAVLPNKLLTKCSTLQSFTGSEECGILQSDLYLITNTSDHKTSPFCNNRATLLEALSSGAQYGPSGAFVGEGDLSCD